MQRGIIRLFFPLVIFPKLQPTLAITSPPCMPVAVALAVKQTDMLIRTKQSGQPRQSKHPHGSSSVPGQAWLVLSSLLAQQQICLAPVWPQLRRTGTRLSLWSMQPHSCSLGWCSWEFSAFIVLCRGRVTHSSGLPGLTYPALPCTFCIEIAGVAITRRYVTGPSACLQDAATGWSPSNLDSESKRQALDGIDPGDTFHVTCSPITISP